jgi:hypothetical protein
MIGYASVPNPRIKCPLLCYQISVDRVTTIVR